jgi:NADH:ubiquinone oxidoreductase subunit K
MSGLSNTIKITMVEVSEPEPDNMPIIMNVIFTLVGAASAIIVIVIVKYAKKKKEEGKVKDVKMDSEFDL